MNGNECMGRKTFLPLFHVDTTNNKRDIKEIKYLHINPRKS